ncbi:MAG TPA: hypothetical protein VIO94_05040 [Phenylobacterium sp.]
MSRVPSGEIFAAMASELQHAGELCEMLETVMTRLVRGGGLSSPESAVRDAQTVDALAQHLQGLANFAEALSRQREKPGGYELSSALKTITLAALASRLAVETGQAQAGGSSDREEEGELQLF